MQRLKKVKSACFETVVSEGTMRFKTCAITEDCKWE